MINELDLFNALKEVGIGILFLMAVWRLTSTGMQFMDRRAIADEQRTVNDDALMTRLLKFIEQQVQINGHHAEFQAGILKTIGDLSHQFVIATTTINASTTSTSRALGGVIESIADGNETLARTFELALGNKTELALANVRRVQETADAISMEQSTMQEQIRDLAKTIVGAADEMRELQQLEKTRENADEQFRDYLKQQLDGLTQTLSNAEQLLITLSNQDKREEVQNEAVDVVSGGSSPAS